MMCGMRPVVAWGTSLLATMLLVALLLATLFLVTGCGGGTSTPEAEVPNSWESLRIGTFNVQFLPKSSDDITRSEKIADRILASTYDVIALNEVFDEEARDTFVAELKGTFPHYVSYLGDDAVGSEDSGLMIFSRFPFVALPSTTHKAEEDDVDARSDGVDWKQVAFIEYDADVFPDNWAAKGAALVRIRNPHTQRIYTVAFTHLQASYPEDEEDLEEWIEPINARRSQLDDARDVIMDTLGAPLFAKEDTFLIGDLNVDGDLQDPDIGGVNCCRPNLYEWVERFGTSGRFFTDSLQDAWAVEHPIEDRGLTNYYHWGPAFAPETGARLDYILRNRTATPPSRSLCIQHLTLAHNMRRGAPYTESGLGMAGIRALSDHIGLNADINRWAPHCNPMEARENPPFDSFLDGTVTYPGSMQWYRFDTPGTYAFYMVSTGFEYRIYQAKDLSTPTPQYHNETTTIYVDNEPFTGQKFHLPDPPFYVRAYHPDRTASGDYALIAHRHDCSSQEEAGVLRACDPVHHTLPPTPINADDTAWFELLPEVADSGLPQNAVFVVDQFAGEDFELEVRAADGKTVIASDEMAEVEPDTPGSYRLRIERREIGGKKIYLLVKRTNLAATSFRIRWETNLTIMHGTLAGIAGSSQLHLYCVEETDTIGIDEVYLTVTVDGTKVVNDVYLGDFDDGVYETLEHLIPVSRFLEGVVVTLREEDGGANGDDDYLVTGITGLPPDATQHLGTSTTISGSGGKYLFVHNRSRNLPVDP